MMIAKILKSKCHLDRNEIFHRSIDQSTSQLSKLTGQPSVKSKLPSPRPSPVDGKIPTSSSHRLLWKLSGGAVHATDVTNASRTMLMNIETLKVGGKTILTLATGWPLRYFPTSRWQQNKGCVLVHGPHTKTGLLFWRQREVGNYLNGHPVELEVFNAILCFFLVGPLPPEVLRDSWEYSSRDQVLCY